MSKEKTIDEIDTDLRDELIINNSHESRMEALMIEALRMLRIIAKVEKPNREGK